MTAFVTGIFESLQSWFNGLGFGGGWQDKITGIFDYIYDWIERSWWYGA